MRIRRLFLSVAAWLFSVTLFAQTSDINMSGGVRVGWDQDYVRVSIDRIDNDDDGGRSGSLKVIVYFSPTYYSSGRLSGVKVFEKEIERIRGGYYRTNTALAEPWLKRPEKGSYYVVVAILEYDGRDDTFYIVDSHTMSEKVDL